METFLLGESRRLFPLPAQQGEGGERPTREPGEGQTPCVDQNKQKFGSSGDFRQQATNAETKLWLALRDRRLSGFKFVRQAAILSYVVDFVCREKKLIVEVDGGQHADNTDDLRRDATLSAEGYQVLRF